MDINRWGLSDLIFALQEMYLVSPPEGLDEQSSLILT